MSENITVYKTAHLGKEPATKAEVNAAKRNNERSDSGISPGRGGVSAAIANAQGGERTAEVNATKRNSGSEIRADGGISPGRHGVSDALAGRSGGSDGGSEGSGGGASVAKSQSDGERAAAVHLVKKAYHEREESKVLDTNDPFDERAHRKEIRETADTLRRLKVLNGKVSPANPQERRLANLEGDRLDNAIDAQMNQLPGAGETTAAKSIGPGSDGTAGESDGGNGFVRHTGATPHRRGANVFAREDE